MSIVLFFIGLFIGSFLLVVIDRFPRGESIFFGRSHCEMCGHSLSWYDLLPILSFVLLKGKCRYCHKPYGFSYPFVEVVTGLAFASIPFFFPMVHSLELLILCIVLSCFIVIFFCDLFYGLIPDVAVLILTCATLGYIFVEKLPFLTHVLAGFGAMGFFFLLYIVTKKKGMGFGDVKLAFPLGFLLGFPQVILGFYVAFLTGAIVALILIVIHKKRFRGDTISFGPFLVFGAYIALIGGYGLWSFFLQLLFHS